MCPVAAESKNSKPSSKKKINKKTDMNVSEAAKHEKDIHDQDAIKNNRDTPSDNLENVANNDEFNDSDEEGKGLANIKLGPKGIYTDVELTKPDIIKDDQSVGMLTDKGWVMMSGCGHSGIINTAKKLQSIKNVPVYGAIGGFHLFRADDETIINTANWFKDNGLTKFMGGHCTGIHAANEIASIIGIKREDLSHTAVGSILTKDLNIIRSSVE